MTSRQLLNVAALAFSATVLAVAFIAIPNASISPPTITAAILLAASVWSAFYVTTSTIRERESVSLASIGPAGLFSIVLILWCGGAVLVALLGHPTASFAMDAISIGGYVVGWSLLKTAMKTVGAASVAAEITSSHSTWQMRLRSLSQTYAGSDVRDALWRLANNLQYAARDTSQNATSENTEIHNLLEALEQSLQTGDAAAAQITMGSITAAFARREQMLKASRSKV